MALPTNLAAEWPSYFGYSLEKRIMTRYEVHQNTRSVFDPRIDHACI